MVTRDSWRLDADVYRPEEEGSLPVLLIRQPYGRAIASTVVWTHPTWYASHGYIVAIQDVLGRGTSEGKFELSMPTLPFPNVFLGLMNGLPSQTSWA
ncbi:peptidase S15 [Microseira wollei NIES-4236]|uniref:Peptidase S15 n=1 Tax=Microseira wollei NIES-4236 TaxID=2530354 RepID=A0AAV3XBX2_9CYAN|nr:peptidase S15 [Microseira wollei NIES-4236]